MPFSEKTLFGLYRLFAGPSVGFGTLKPALKADSDGRFSEKSRSGPARKAGNRQKPENRPIEGRILAKDRRLRGFCVLDRAMKCRSVRYQKQDYCAALASNAAQKAKKDPPDRSSGPSFGRKRPRKATRRSLVAGAVLTGLATGVNGRQSHREPSHASPMCSSRQR